MSFKFKLRLMFIMKTQSDNANYNDYNNDKIMKSCWGGISFDKVARQEKFLNRYEYFAVLKNNISTAVGKIDKRW